RQRPLTSMRRVAHTRTLQCDDVGVFWRKAQELHIGNRNRRNRLAAIWVDYLNTICTALVQLRSYHSGFGESYSSTPAKAKYKPLGLYLQQRWMPSGLY